MMRKPSEVGPPFGPTTPATKEGKRKTVVQKISLTLLLPLQKLTQIYLAITRSMNTDLNLIDRSSMPM